MDNEFKNLSESMDKIEARIKIKEGLQKTVIWSKNGKEKNKNR